MKDALLSLSHMPWKSLQFSLDSDGVATLTISRPERLNALNAECIGELCEVFEQVESDSAVRGLILTGAGEKAFVAAPANCKVGGGPTGKGPHRTAGSGGAFRPAGEIMEQTGGGSYH